MQITDNLSGDDSTNHLLDFNHHERKLSCIQALTVKEFVHQLSTVCSLWSIYEYIVSIKKRICPSSQ